MEAFSLLKYWRSGGGASGGSTATADSTAHPRPTTKTIVTAAAVSPYSSDGEEGPYFDLEFAIPDPDSDADENPSAKSQETDNEDETESGSSDDTTEEISMHENDEEEEEEECTDQNATFSPSDELFSQGNLVKVEPSTILLNGSDENFKFPVSLVKSATKFRVLLLKLKKSKSGNSGDEAANVQVSSTPKIAERESHGKVLNRKFLAVKFRVEEVPLVSLFTRDTSSKEIIHGRGLKTNNNVEDSESNTASDERKLTKEVVQEYLKMVKPLYVRVSKLKFSGGGSKGCAAPPEGVAEAALDSGKTPHVKQGNSNLQAGLEVVRKHLGKSRSASAAVAEAPPGKATSNRRRDDSLLQVQDGIQGAILHCKRSFNAASGGDVESSSILCRSASDPSYEKSMMMQKAPLSSSFSGEAKIE